METKKKKHGRDHNGMTSCQDLFKQLDDAWGFIFKQNIAPVWLGEFGTCHTSPSCISGTQGNGFWFSCMLQYIKGMFAPLSLSLSLSLSSLHLSFLQNKENRLPWSYWALDGTQSTGTGRVYGQSEDYGVLNLTWNGPAYPAHLAALQSIQHL